ncbi:hypothetical protein SAMN04490191_4212 [Pseudomonas lini]|uniref:Uncharacterized protein n=1 Tax=Pseudomonas lini TaxID=163011 RepID=A0A1H1ZZB1_9PSED|nr:hypothetical protein SAMN04490191_4212 [Pseudomonas lini]
MPAKGGLIADLFLADVHRSNCGSWLACDGGLIADWDFDGVHIRFCGNANWRFRFYSESLFQTPKRNQKALPLHSVPRLGSACHNEGIAPGARRHRPSMAGGGYRGILAAVPPTQSLRSASGKGATDQNQKPKQQQDQQHREQARSHRRSGYIQNLCTTQILWERACPR